MRRAGLSCEVAPCPSDGSTRSVGVLRSLRSKVRARFQARLRALKDGAAPNRVDEFGSVHAKCTKSWRAISAERHLQQSTKRSQSIKNRLEKMSSQSPQSPSCSETTSSSCDQASTSNGSAAPTMMSADILKDRFANLLDLIQTEKAAEFSKETGREGPVTSATAAASVGEAAAHCQQEEVVVSVELAGGAHGAQPSLPQLILEMQSVEQSMLQDELVEAGDALASAKNESARKCKHLQVRVAQLQRELGTLRSLREAEKRSHDRTLGGLAVGLMISVAAAACLHTVAKPRA